MPTITIKKADLENLVGDTLEPGRLEEALAWVKGELKEYAAATDEARIELSDSNRPDLWSVEGIARQIRPLLGPGRPRPPFRVARGPARHRIEVEPGVEPVRPYITACVARGVELTVEGLIQLIQTQEKLADLYGRRRRTVSIGYYRLAGIEFPVRYRAVSPDGFAFVPLGEEREMTLRQILAEHPKGREYGGILATAPRWPLLVDANDRILSFPPIINSRALGEVQPGDSELLVEVTGTDLRMVLLTVNILAANLADRGARILPVETRFPFPTPFGRRVVAPRPVADPIRVTSAQASALLGDEISTAELRRLLSWYGYQTRVVGKAVRATLPPYRDDGMHAVDVIEDVAITRGLETFEPAMPSTFTIGAVAEIETRAARVRDLMIGLGFQEMMSNILASRAELLDRMRLPSATPVVEIANPIADSFAVVRPFLLPLLLRVEASSPRSPYPHRLFEVGEAATPDPEAETESRTETRLAALIAHPEAGFSELHAALEHLFRELSWPYRLEPEDHPSFIPGRCARIVRTEAPGGPPDGLIGELHPEVLERWEIRMPCVGLDLPLGRE